MTWKDKIKQQWNERPVELALVGVAVASVAVKLIDVLSQAQGRRAYAKQVNYRVRSKR